MLHDYECTACGERFEELVRSGEDPDDVPCPRCAAPRAKRVMLSAPTHCSTSGEGGGGCSGFV